MKQTLLALCGALAGGVIGYFAFFWIARQGFYALVLPGGLLGLGAGIAKNRSVLLAVGCGLAATALGLFTEWRFAPFKIDDSLGFFLAHVHELKPVTLVMILLGGGIGFWVPYRRLESSANLDTGIRQRLPPNAGGVSMAGWICGILRQPGTTSRVACQFTVEL